MVFDSTPDDLRSSEATLNSTPGSLGRSSFEVTEAIETSGGETTLLSSSSTNGTNGGLLRSQDLQEAKEQLIVEMADTLSVSRPFAESLLRHNDWSREAVLENMRRDPIETCSRAGLQAPQDPPSFNG